MSQRKKPDSTRQKSQRATAQSKTLPGNASKQQEAIPLQSAPDDREGWKAYWTERQQTWRTEPEIDATRQQELTTCYEIKPDIKEGIYPFRNMKLSRADVEWLLATYGASFTPEKGLDVRGANLRGEDLSGLSMPGLLGGVTFAEWRDVSGKRAIAVTPLQDVLVWVDFREARLDGTDLRGSRLENADFRGAQLVQANLAKTQLKYAKFKGADLRQAWLEGADLTEAHLEGANLTEAHLERAKLVAAQLKSADLAGAYLEGAYLPLAQLKSADLAGANLKSADLRGVLLEDANLTNVQLDGAYLAGVILANVEGISPLLADIRWDGTNLAVVDWSQIKVLGDECRAKQMKNQHGLLQEACLDEYRKAVRANRQLAVAQQDQGLNEEAAHFAYRANVLHRKLLGFQIVQPKILPWRRVRKFGAWCFSHLLNLLAGYGYRPARSFLAYIIIVFGFMGLYLLASHFTAPHLSWDEALVLSLSSFHGRGFFTQTLTLGDPYARLAVTEAVLGLFVEVSLIATFTQRFFGK